jgi:hypothetical protein
MSSKRNRLAFAAAIAAAAIAASVGLASGASAGGSSQRSHLAANLGGFQEVPVINSPGNAQFRATLTSSKITFELKYHNLTGAPLFAHIHVGQRGVNGAVSVFLCGGGGKPACPASTSGTVRGEIVAADVGAIPAQGFAAGDFASLARAIKSNVTYANIHTPNFPTGEIRGQIHRS